MKTWKCPHCKHESEKTDDIIMVKCRCGHYMKLKDNFDLECEMLGIADKTKHPKYRENKK